MRFPDRRDFLDYAEEAPGQSVEVQKQILKILASSPVMREQLLELKKDFYLVDALVPDYMPSPVLASEVTKLGQAWMKIVYARKFSLNQFHRTKEFFYLMLFVGACLLFLLAAFGVHLWM